MLPVTSINGLPIGNGQVGGIFSKILAQWSLNVGLDIEAQIKSWQGANTSNGPTPYKFK